MTECEVCRKPVNEEDKESFIEIDDKLYQLNFLTTIGGDMCFHKECFDERKIIH